MQTTLDINAIGREVESGLPNETERLDCVKKSIEVYNGTYCDPEQSYYDRDHRARRDLPLMSKVIGALTAYPYQEPPTRIVAGKEQATKYLEQVYEQNKITTLLKASDAYRHAGDVFALQVHATLDTLNPINYYAWTADRFVVWCSPEDQRKAEVVCTIDRFDNQTRYRLWTKDECRTYITKKWNGETSGGRVAFFQETMPNPYGILPFVFFHFAQPVTQFHEGGVGESLSRMERHINFRLMEDADHLRFSKPRGFLLGVPPDKELIRRPRAGEWDRFPPNAPLDARTNVAMNPDVKWIGPPLDWVDAEWSDIKHYWNWALETHGVPASAFPLGETIIAAESGAAIIAKNIPLFLYARKTQEQYRHYEQDLARVTLTVADAVYGGFADAVEVPLTVNFGEVVPDMPPDSPEDYLDGLKEKGQMSEVMVICKRFNFTREQAIEHLEQIYKDESEVAALKAKYGIQEVNPEQPGKPGQPSDGQDVKQPSPAANPTSGDE